MGRIGRSTLALVLLVPFVLGAVLAGALGSTVGSAPALVVPAAWGAVRDAAHVREGEHVALLWGARAGADPSASDGDLAFDPDAAVARLESLHALHVTALGLGARDGPAAGRKVLVVVDGTWASGPGVRAAPPGEPVRGATSRAEAVDGVGVLRVTPAVLATAGTEDEDAPGTAEPGTAEPGIPEPGALGAGASPATAVAEGTSWELARGYAEVAILLAAEGRGGGSEGRTPRRSGPRARRTWRPWRCRPGTPTSATCCARRTSPGAAPGTAPPAGCSSTRSWPARTRASSPTCGRRRTTARRSSARTRGSPAPGRRT
ncbi:hypothetical protein GC089_13565 [Cellulomonas sp. JZ18]|nr:hypothetical protein GC089_13565 [Cellulomonas sp. JZ18]